MRINPHKQALTSALVLFAGVATMVVSAIPASAQSASGTTRVDGEGADMLIFLNGNTLKGEVVSETEKAVKFKSSVNGIAFETEYQKSELLDIKRAKKADAKKSNDKANDKASDKAKMSTKDDAKLVAPASGPALGTAVATDAPGNTGTKYYYMTLKGEFGSQITQTPMKDAVEDAYANGADVLIFEMDVDWSRGEAESKEDRKAFEQNFNIFRAVPVNDVLLKHIPSIYGDKKPKIVFWVKNAMGAACFVPMVSCDRYFSPEGKMGGIGNLSTMHSGSSERVKEKWRGASLQTAMGFANWGCMPEEVIRAMSRVEQVLSVRYVDGKPQYFESYPENPGEELLTDSGKESEQDTIDQLARWQGNDVLTLTADIAEKLQLSKGTISSKDELLDTLGLSRNGIAVDKRVDNIIKRWADGLDMSKNRLLKALRDYQEINVQGTWEERRSARGRQQRTIDEIITIVRQYGEGIQPRWSNEHGIPMNEQGQPDIDSYLNLKDRIKTDQQLDKK